jgi:hypothetical protein
VPSFLLFTIGLGALLLAGSLPARFADLAEILGSVALVGSFIWAYWFHRWEVVSDQSA